MLLVLDVKPATSLGPFHLGMPLNDAIRVVREAKHEYGCVEVKYGEPDPYGADITLQFPEHGLALRFDPHRQLLRLASIYDLTRMQIRYGRAVVGGLSQPATFSRVYEAFGPTYPGEYDARASRYALQYPGLLFTFPVGGQQQQQQALRDHMAALDPQLLPLDLPGGAVLQASQCMVFAGPAAPLEQLEGRPTASELPGGASVFGPPPRPLRAVLGAGLFLGGCSDDSSSSSLCASAAPAALDALGYGGGGGGAGTRGVCFGHSPQDVLTELGPPDSVFVKPEGTAGVICYPGCSPDIAPGARPPSSSSSSVPTAFPSTSSPAYYSPPPGYTYNYFRLGLDVVFDGRSHTVAKIKLHTNLPAHPDFNLYHRAAFELLSLPDALPAPSPAGAGAAAAPVAAQGSGGAADAVAGTGTGGAAAIAAAGGSGTTDAGLVAATVTAPAAAARDREVAGSPLCAPAAVPAATGLCVGPSSVGGDAPLPTANGLGRAVEDAMGQLLQAQPGGRSPANKPNEGAANGTAAASAPAVTPAAAEVPSAPQAGGGVPRAATATDATAIGKRAGVGEVPHGSAGAAAEEKSADPASQACATNKKEDCTVLNATQLQQPPPGADRVATDVAAAPQPAGKAGTAAGVPPAKGGSALKAAAAPAAAADTITTGSKAAKPPTNTPAAISAAVEAVVASPTAGHVEVKQQDLKVDVAPKPDVTAAAAQAASDAKPTAPPSPPLTAAQRRKLLRGSKGKKGGGGGLVKKVASPKPATGEEAARPEKAAAKDGEAQQRQQQQADKDPAKAGASATSSAAKPPPAPKARTHDAATTAAAAAKPATAAIAKERRGDGGAANDVGLVSDLGALKDGVASMATFFTSLPQLLTDFAGDEIDGLDDSPAAAAAAAAAHHAQQQLNGAAGTTEEAAAAPVAAARPFARVGSALSIRSVRSAATGGEGWESDINPADLEAAVFSSAAASESADAGGGGSSSAGGGATPMGGSHPSSDYTPPGSPAGRYSSGRDATAFAGANAPVLPTPPPGTAGGTVAAKAVAGRQGSPADGGVRGTSVASPGCGWSDPKDLSMFAIDQLQAVVPQGGLLSRLEEDYIPSGSTPLTSHVLHAHHGAFWQASNPYPGPGSGAGCDASSGGGGMRLPVDAGVAYEPCYDNMHAANGGTGYWQYNVDGAGSSSSLADDAARAATNAASSPTISTLQKQQPPLVQVATGSSSWDEVQSVMGDAGRATVHPLPPMAGGLTHTTAAAGGGGGCGSRTLRLYGYKGAVFEVLDNGRLASVTLFRV